MDIFRRQPNKRTSIQLIARIMLAILALSATSMGCDGSPPPTTRPPATEEPTTTQVPTTEQPTTEQPTTTPRPPPSQPSPQRLIPLEGEDGQPVYQVMDRGNASQQQTMWLHRGESLRFGFTLQAAARYQLVVRYSNDNNGALEQVTLRIDGLQRTFSAQDTGNFGEGWNVFREESVGTPVNLRRGDHSLVISVSGGDGYGIEIDRVRLRLVR